MAALHKMHWRTASLMLKRYDAVALEKTLGAPNELLSRTRPRRRSRVAPDHIVRSPLTMALRFWRGRSKIFVDRVMEIAAPTAAAGIRWVMARPREFDETIALKAAMNCFWAQGFEQTSVRNLAERMGITGASLYNAFGDKRSLYRQAFVHYLTQTVRDRVARLDKLPPREALRTFFDEIIERSVDDEQRRGCMLVNAALELAPYDPEFQQLVAEEMIFIEAFFRRCAEAAQKDGSITDRGSADGIAKLLLSVLLGIRVLARTRPQREVLEGAAKGAFALLGKASN